jgi:CBS domain-containing protein
MSPRAAWRLESLGFEQVYDYVAGKQDWGAFGLSLEGRLTEVGYAGDLARTDVPTCRLDDRLGDVRERARAAGWELAIVVNDEEIVLGRVGRKALREASSDARVEEVMSSGPGTIRPNTDLERIVQRLQERGLTSVVVTRSDGRLVGVLRREDAERRLAERGAS